MAHLLRRAARDRKAGYTDLHCHILSSLDDGPSDMRESLTMARTAMESGAARVFATPHYAPGAYTPTPETIRSSVSRLRACLAESGLDLEIVEGSEILLTDSISEDFREGRLVTLGQTGFLLVELPWLSVPEYARQEIFALKVAGAGVILAHPERNDRLRDSPPALRELLEAGVYLQVNAGSFVGAYGREVQRFAARLLGDGFVHFLGSDAHSGAHPGLARSGADVRPALARMLRAAGRSELASLERRVEDLLSGRLSR